MSKKQTLQVALTKTSWKTRRNKLAGVSKEISMSAVVLAVLARLKAFFLVKTEKYKKNERKQKVFHEDQHLSALLLTGFHKSGA